MLDKNSGGNSREIKAGIETYKFPFILTRHPLDLLQGIKLFFGFAGMEQWQLEHYVL